MKKSGLLGMVLFGILLMSLSMGLGTAFAGSAALSGSLDSSDPTLLVAIISTPNCTGSYGSVDVHYDLIPFTVDVSGSYTFQAVGSPDNIAVYLLENSFNPGAVATNCAAASNSNPINFSFALTAGTPYFLVVFDDTVAQSGMSYTGSITGPGNITLGGSVDCPYPLPVGSVVYNIPAGAPAFFAADLGSGTGFNIPAGTWYISEFSGDFAKMWVACQASPVWVPTNAVGGPVG